MKRLMDAERRKRLEERRRFAQPRIEGIEFRNDPRAEPAFHLLEQAGESFAFYSLYDAPDWVPEWWPAKYSRIPWEKFPDAHVITGGLYREQVRDLVFSMLRARLRPADRMLVCGQVVLELKLAAFERHFDAVIRTFGGMAHFSAPPAQWVFRFEYGQMAWRDPAQD